MFEALCRSRSAPDSDLLKGFVTVRDRINIGETELDLARAGLGKGVIRTFFGEDSLVNVVDLIVDRPIHSQSETLEDLILIRANIGSACTYIPPGGISWRFVRPEVTVSVLPRGCKFDVVIEPDMLHTAVTMLVRPAALVDRYGLRRDDLPAPLIQAIDGEFQVPTRLFSLPLEPGIASLVEDLVRSRLPASLRSLQVSARGLELLVLIVAAWKERLLAGNEASLRGRDAYLIAAARRILTQRLVDPPTLQELAQELGTNRNKLNQIFQRGLGVTPKAFCVQRRIERAQVLLREGRLNVAQIAETVGYQHQSSFAAAFRDMVGMCPRDYGSAKRADLEYAQS
jgi:AraC-like DNA-binding protein